MGQVRSHAITLDLDLPTSTIYQSVGQSVGSTAKKMRFLLRKRAWSTQEADTGSGIIKQWAMIQD